MIVTACKCQRARSAQKRSPIDHIAADSAGGALRGAPLNAGLLTINQGMLELNWHALDW